jgi:hypothetical protein
VFARTGDCRSSFVGLAASPTAKSKHCRCYHVEYDPYAHLTLLNPESELLVTGHAFFVICSTVT